MTTTPFTVNPVLSAIVVAYRNRQLIADMVLPYVTAVGTKEFRYTLFPQGEILTVPDSKVGRRGRPNVVEFTGTETPAATTDYGLEDEIPQDDITQAAAAGNPALAGPVERSTEWLAQLIGLDREVRVAGLVFNPATYAAANKTQLAGATQWSDPASDPIAAIEDNLESVLMRPNVGVLGGQTWSALRRHPKVVKAVNKTAGDTGLVRKEDFAEMFELEELHIGRSFVNTAKKGQAAVLSRAWGKHAAFIHQDKLADRNRGVSFGYTVPFGTKIAGQREDPVIGLRGGTIVRVGESVCELITAADAAFFFQDAVA
jgi:hypothetical protein